MKKLTLRLFGFLGVVLFLPLFFLTFIDVHSIERAASSFIEWKLTSETEKKIDGIELPATTKLEKLLGKKSELIRQEAEDQLTIIKQKLKASYPKILAEEIAKLKNINCECRRLTEAKISNFLQATAISLESQINLLKEFSHKKYMEIVIKLTLDVRIFLGANAVIFLLFIAVSFLKPTAITHLFIPSGLLLISTITCSYFYLFEQNWFYTILYNDYVGYGFITYLVVVFTFLVDISFNRGNITTTILNGILEAIGQIPSVIAC